MADAEAEALLERWNKELESQDAEGLCASLAFVLTYPGLKRQARRAIIRTIAIRLAVKVMEPGFLDE
jgi:hypothetical protein